MRLLAILACGGLAAILLPGASASGPRGPNAFAVGRGSVWVGFGDGRVVRVSGRRGAVRRVVPPKITGFVGGVAVGFGSVWVARHDSTVVRLDGGTGRVKATLDPPWSPTHVSVGDDAVWVGDSGRSTIFRVDPRTDRVSGRARLRGGLMGLATGAGAVWVLTAPDPVTGWRGRRVLWRLNPKTLLPRRVLRIDCNATLHTAQARLWVLDNCNGSLRSLDTTTWRWTNPVATLSDASGLAVGFGAVWVSDGSTLMRVGTKRRSARIAVKGQMLAAGPRALWVLDMGNGVTGWLRRIDPATNRFAGRAIRLSAR